MMSLSVFFTYALQFYVPVEIILPWVHRRVGPDHHLKAEYALRYLMVMITFSLAAAIPKLDLFISLVGSISSSTLALMAPPIIHSLTYWNDLKSSKYGVLLILRNLFLFCLGFVGFI